MAKKTYRTFRLKGLQILMKDKDGNRKEIIFRSGMQIDSTARFSTNDEYIQEKLESMDGFGKSYYLESTTGEETKEPEEEEKVVAESPAPKMELTDVKDIKRFHNLVEMRNYMVEIGLPVTGETNYMKAKAIAQKAGYDFQIQK